MTFFRNIYILKRSLNFNHNDYELICLHEFFELFHELVDMNSRNAKYVIEMIDIDSEILTIAKQIRIFISR